MPAVLPVQDSSGDFQDGSNESLSGLKVDPAQHRVFPASLGYSLKSFGN